MEWPLPSQLLVHIYIITNGQITCILCSFSHKNKKFNNLKIKEWGGIEGCIIRARTYNNIYLLKNMVIRCK